MSYKSLVQVIKEHNTPVELLEIQQKEVDLDEDFMTLFFALWGTGAMLVLPALMIYDVANRNSNYKLDAKVGEIVGKLLSKFKKDKNYKPNSAEIDASKKLEKEVKSKEPSIFNKAMSKLKSIKSIKEHNAGMVSEGKYQKYSDLLIKKSKLVAQGPIAQPEIDAVNKQIAAEMKKLGVKE